MDFTEIDKKCPTAIIAEQISLTKDCTPANITKLQPENKLYPLEKLEENNKNICQITS